MGVCGVRHQFSSCGHKQNRRVNTKSLQVNTRKPSGRRALFIFYLHNNNFHVKNFIFCTGFICDVCKLVDLRRVNLLKDTTAEPKVKGEGTESATSDAGLNRKVERNSEELENRVRECQCGSGAHLDFSSDEEASYADELQSRLEDVSLCGHEAVKVVLSVVVCLPSQLVHLAHLKEQHNVEDLGRAGAIKEYL